MIKGVRLWLLKDLIRSMGCQLNRSHVRAIDTTFFIPFPVFECSYYTDHKFILAILTQTKCQRLGNWQLERCRGFDSHETFPIESSVQRSTTSLHINSNVKTSTQVICFFFFCIQQ